MVEKLNPKDFTTLKDKNISLFDIYFRDSKTKKKIGLPVGQYTVVMPKEKGKVVEKVYYVDDSGKVEEKTFTQNDKAVTFVTTHFSKYAVKYKLENKLENNNNNNNNNNSVIADNNKKSGRKSKLAKTGIAQMSLLPTVLLGIVSVALSKKRR